MKTEAKYLDAHTHVNLAAFKDDYREVIERALEAGVGLVNVGTQKDTSLRAVEIAHEFPGGVYAVVGLHPVHTSKSFHDAQELGDTPEAKGFTPTPKDHRSTTEKHNQKDLVWGFTSRGEIFDYEYYKKLALDPKVIAIGECGLDYYRIETDKADRTDIDDAKEKQKSAFMEQIKLAHEVKKPLMIHCRSAFSDLIEILIHNSSFLVPNNPGIIHFFTGTKDDARKLLDLGFYFTFGGVVTFVRDYDKVIKMIPVERILSETDAPYVSPAPHRGKRNEPAYVIEVVKKLAEIKEISLEEIREKILDNIRSIFGIKFNH